MGPNYQHPDYLRQAIDSALGQTYRNIEVIVVNDGSNDGGKAEEIAKSYGDRIRYFYKENGGVASALNMGIREMTGEYFSWLSHDDVYYPNKIEVQINYLKSGKRNVVLYSDYVFIDSRSRFIRTGRIRDINPMEFRYSLIMSHPIHGCTALIPRACFDKAGLFDERLRTTQDYVMWFNMARYYDFIHTPDVLIRSRLHAEQVSHTISTHHLKESNEFFIWCMEQLSVKEVLSASGGRSLAASYFKIAINLRKRGYHVASAHVYKMALNHLREDGFTALLKNFVLLSYYKFISLLSHC